MAPTSPHRAAFGSTRTGKLLVSRGTISALGALIEQREPVERVADVVRGPAKTLEAFTKATSAAGSIVHTDGLFSYNGLGKLGYRHRPRKVANVGAGEQLLPRAHRAISNLKAWMHGTHRGVSGEHLPVYLDEYVFRHNRRGTPMAAFQTLLGLGALHKPTTYRQITLHDRAA